MANCTLKPFRDYDEHDVINLFKYSGAIPGLKGTFVDIVGNGWNADDQPNNMLGAAGKAYDNTVSQRYGVAAAVNTASSGSTDPLGMLLYDVREEDENGEKLLYNPRKAAEMECVLSGQAVPVVTKGVFLYSGDTISAQTVTAGAKLYIGTDGMLTTTASSAGKVVGHALGSVDSTSSGVLFKLEL
tara:strand:- start:3133 stop:3690 length:558 start_codon:yes stop_codon:yes gene_type:complete